MIVFSRQKRDPIQVDSFQKRDPSPKRELFWRRALFFLFLLFLLFLFPASSTAVCADDSSKKKSPEKSPESSEDSPTTGQRLKVKLEQVASGFQKPLYLLFPPGSSRSTYVVEQGGRIFRINAGKKTLFLDLSGTINSSSGEQGLLSFDFAPNYREGSADSSYCYVNYTAGRFPTYSYLTEFKVTGKTPTVLLDQKRTLLRIRQPYSNHNGGLLLFGPDGMLYVGFGDGGSAGDPLNAGQDRKTWLGKILRINPRPAKQAPYQVPTDNPFYGNASYLPEIYALGLRNPWRFSFDRLTGRLYVADVGQNQQEEINLVEAGGNYGWRRKEGNLCYNPRSNCASAGLIDPIHVYNHPVGQSITGGYVYRGSKLASYKGHYFFADYVSGKLWALPLDSRTGRAAGEVILLLSQGGSISSFGEDQDGELYVTEHRTGKIFRIVAD